MSSNPLRICTETDPLRVAVFVSGRGSNLKALIDAGANGSLPCVRFSLVFSDIERPPAFDHAEGASISTAHVAPSAHKKRADYEGAVLEKLKAASVEFIVLAGYMRLVGKTLLDTFPNRIINIHPALLPAFPGLHAQRQAVEYGVKLSGCTVHFVDSGMDTGPIILQRAVPCESDDTEESLSARILIEEHKTLPLALDLVSRGCVRVEGRKVHISRPA